MKILHSIGETQSCCHEWKRRGKTVGFIPTMGALHQGHLSLVRQARLENDFVAVSIFVNPTQFAAGEDFETYPRTLEQDIQKIKPLGKSHSIFIFAPESEKEIYPNGKDLINAHGPIDTLEGFLRPGHFDGVATVVKRLFGIVRPQKAYFGSRFYASSEEGGLTLPNIEKIASAYGIHFMEMKTTDDIRNKVEESLKLDKPSICRLKISAQQVTSPRTTSRQTEDGSMETAPMEEMWPELT